MFRNSQPKCTIFANSEESFVAETIRIYKLNNPLQYCEVIKYQPVYIFASQINNKIDCQVYTLIWQVGNLTSWDKVYCTLTRFGVGSKFAVSLFDVVIVGCECYPCFLHGWYLWFT